MGEPEPRGIGKAYVIELNLIEAKARSLDRDRNIVFPDLLIEGISPSKLLAISEDRAVGPLYRELGPRRRQRIIFEYYDSGDRVDLLTMQTLQQRSCVVHRYRALSACLLCQWNRAFESDHASIALDVDHHGIEFGLADQIDSRLAQLCAADPVEREIERLGLEGVRATWIESPARSCSATDFL